MNAEPPDILPGEPNWQALLTIADELERWVVALPERFGPAWEGYEACSRRVKVGEVALVERLRRLPGCTVSRSVKGNMTTLDLAGLQVRSTGGIAGACRDWIRKARTLAKRHGSN